MDIDDKKLIYFYSPMGAWRGINMNPKHLGLIGKNLQHLGLNKKKIIGNIYTRDFLLEVLNDTYMEKYKDIDVLCLHEFYDLVFNDPKCINSIFEAITKLISKGKQIVLSGHNRIDLIKFIPEEIRKQIVSYDLNYNLD